MTAHYSRKIYLIGSLRNSQIPWIAEQFREDGHRVFDDWFSAGPGADDAWKAHEEFKGRSLIEALLAPAAQHVLDFDNKWLDWCDTAILAMPAGKSAHLELGSQIGARKDTHVLFPKDTNLQRWDVMYGKANGVWASIHSLRKHLLYGGN